MVSINRLLSRAAARHGLLSFVRWFFVWVTGALCSLLVLAISQRLLGFAFWWWTAVIGAISMAVIGAAVTAAVLRRSRLDIARLLDDRLSLREALSTAVCVSSLQDPWSRAALEQASIVSRRVIPRQALPLTAPRWWPTPLALMLLLYLTGFLPQYDLLGWGARADASQKQDQDLLEARRQAQTAQARVSEALAKVNDLGLGKEDPASKPEAPKAQSADELRLQAVKQLTRVQDRLAELKKGDKAAAMQELARKLQSLQPPGEGPVDAMTKALQQGNFDLAAKELEALAAKLESGELTDAQKASLKDQMLALSKQFSQAAERQKELESKLQDLGLDKKLASNPDALKKALDSAKQLTPEQKQALQRTADASAAACKQCNGLAAAAQAAAGQLAQAGKNGAAALAQMGDQLSALEMAQQEMNAIDAAQAEAMSQLASLSKSLGRCEGGGEGQADAMMDLRLQEKWGSGTSAGGVGGQRPSAEKDFKTQDSKARVKNQAGPIIGSTLVQGDQIKGESVQQFAQAVEAGNAAAAEAIESKQVPREYQDAVRHYFGRLKSKAPAGASPQQPSRNDGAPTKQESQSPAPKPEPNQSGGSSRDAGGDRPS